MMPWWVMLIALLIGYAINWIIHLLSTGETEDIVANSTEKMTRKTDELKEGQQDIKQRQKKIEVLLYKLSRQELEKTDLSRDQVAAASSNIASSIGQHASPVLFQGGAVEKWPYLMIWTKDGPQPFNPLGSEYFVDFGKSLANGNADASPPNG